MQTRNLIPFVFTCLFVVSVDATAEEPHVAQATKAIRGTPKLDGVPDESWEKGAQG